MVTSTEVTNYLASIYDAQSQYVDFIVIKERLGHQSLIEKRILITLLDMYVDIMVRYFKEATYPGGYFDTTNNFFDVEEIEDIMLRINLIAGVDYHLNL